MKTTGAGSKKRSLAEFRAMHKVAGPNSPIYQSGLTMTSVRALKSSATTSPTPTAGATSPASTTTGPPTQPEKPFGIVSRHEGEMYSPENAATVSFGYFRTKSGLPPDVEKAKASKG